LDKCLVFRLPRPGRSFASTHTPAIRTLQDRNAIYLTTHLRLGPYPAGLTTHPHGGAGALPIAPCQPTRRNAFARRPAQPHRRAGAFPSAQGQPTPAQLIHHAAPLTAGLVDHSPIRARALGITNHTASTTRSHPPPTAPPGPPPYTSDPRKAQRPP
jgi:hypothetical protein